MSGVWGVVDILDSRTQQGFHGRNEVIDSISICE